MKGEKLKKLKKLGKLGKVNTCLIVQYQKHSKNRLVVTSPFQLSTFPDSALCAPIRSGRTASQRAQAIKRRRQIWEALHQNSGNSFSTIPADEPRGRGRPPEFASETAAAAGMTKQAINQHLARADALGDDLERIVGTSITPARVWLSSCF